MRSRIAMLLPTPAMNLRFGGSFPGAQQAQGTLSFKSVYPSCTSADVAWTATTTAQPPPPPDTAAPVVRARRARPRSASRPPASR